MRQKSIMQVVLNKKSTKEVTLSSVGLCLNMSDFLFQFYKICFKKYSNTSDVYYY